MKQTKKKMAASCRNVVCRFAPVLKGSERAAYPLLIQFRNSVYDKRFVDPIIDKRILEEDVDIERGQRVKAAPIGKTTLFNYDPKVEQDDIHFFNLYFHRFIRICFSTQIYPVHEFFGLFTNRLMYHSEKVVARNIVEKAFELIKRQKVATYHRTENIAEKEKIEIDPLKIFHKALENCKPVLMIISVQVAGTRYPVPVPCPDKTGERLAMNFIIRTCRDEKGRLSNLLARELILAAENTGFSVSKKQALHKKCEQNRAYSHYRWG